MSHGTGWSWVTETRTINEGQTKLYGVDIFEKDGEGDYVVYEGLDATSGRILFEKLEDDVRPLSVNFVPPLRLDRGLYVVFGSKVNGMLFRWDPVIGERPTVHLDT